MPQTKFGLSRMKVVWCHACWPQHAAFIGVVFYSVASIATPNSPEPAAVKASADAPAASSATGLEPIAMPVPATPTAEKR
jgi:hypothetical protein